MSNRRDKIARAITAFVENPVTNLVKGIALLLIGLTEASRTFREDVAHGQVRVGHGLVIIGLFSILGALPHLIEGLEAGRKYLELTGRGVGCWIPIPFFSIIAELTVLLVGFFLLFELSKWQTYLIVLRNFVVLFGAHYLLANYINPSRSLGSRPRAGSPACEPASRPRPRSSAITANRGLVKGVFRGPGRQRADQRPSDWSRSMSI
jgi:hypothetical protein